MKSLLYALVFLGLISLGYSLKCFVCNSHEEEDCYSMPESSRSKFLKECNDEVSINHTHHNNYTLCRKLHMFMDQDVGKIHSSEDRVHRACGFVENNENMKMRGDCYYKSGYNTRTWVCSCKEDECNAASTIFGSSSTILAMLAPTIVVMVTLLRNAAPVF